MNSKTEQNAIEFLKIENMEIVDILSLKSRFEWDFDLLGDLLILFNEDCDGYVQSIIDAINEQNSDELRKKAHALKGSIANFDAPRAKAIATHLEKMGIENSFSRGIEIVDALRDEISKFVHAINVILKKGGF